MILWWAALNKILQTKVLMCGINADMLACPEKCAGKWLLGSGGLGSCHLHNLWSCTKKLWETVWGKCFLVVRISFIMTTKYQKVKENCLFFLSFLWIIHLSINLLWKNHKLGCFEVNSIKFTISRRIASRTVRRRYRFLVIGELLWWR